MAEYISGNEDEFVRQMNQRARKLGMEHTNFVNCNGLDVDGHEISARDIAIMSRELITKYPQIYEYCTIWMENITHTTRKGTSEFGLTNTNKLIRQYEYATGLKTGSTGMAKFCVSATARKNDVEMIAVIMGADDSKIRFQDAVNLLNYGFGACQIYKDENPPKLDEAEVEGGVEEKIPCEYEHTFQYLDTTGQNLSEITKRVSMKKKLQAPVQKGDVIGSLIYELDGQEIGQIQILAGDSCEKADIWDYFKKLLIRIRV